METFFTCVAHDITKVQQQCLAQIFDALLTNSTFVYVAHDQTEAMTLGDLIVIMKDGFIQQIGTPHMNFFDAKLIKKDGKYAVEAGGITVGPSEDKQARLAANNVEAQDITLGVRPDHIVLCENGIKGRVNVSELIYSFTTKAHGYTIRKIRALSWKYVANSLGVPIGKWNDYSGRISALLFLPAFDL